MPLNRCWMRLAPRSRKDGRDWSGWRFCYLPPPVFVGSLQDALDKIWAPRPSEIWIFLRNKLFSFSLVLVAAFLLLISLVLSTLMTALAGHITTALGLPAGVVQTVIVAANFILTAIIFAAIFKFVPSVLVTWLAAFVGGLFTAILFAVGRMALAWYLAREAEASAYGAATSLVLLLIWIYYSAQLLFLGAQFSQSFQNAGTVQRAADVRRLSGTEAAEAVPIEKYFSNVLAAVGLGFLLGAAVAQRPTRPPSPRLRPRTSFMQTASNLMPSLLKMIRY
jgi:Virulence factor BrkB